VVSPFTISIGNLAMGGRGKTPVAIHVAKRLVEAGERTAVLSRGYGRRVVEDGVVIVSDGQRLNGDLDRSGDEPMLIALSVPGAAVLVCEQRAIAAALATNVLGTTAHVLDDGFQHHAMRRDLDIVIISARDVTDYRVPFGRLRESVGALTRAHAILVDGPVPDRFLEHLPEDLRTKRCFALNRSLGSASPLEPDRPWLAVRGPALALTGIAEPKRFTQVLEADGWAVAGLVSFPDHHQYRSDDLDRVVKSAHDAGVNAVVTTEKDAVRLLPLRPLPIPIAAVPLEIAIEPIDGGPGFGPWMFQEIAEARA
jgi:tetraacyldisaccharide 4'-kinase